MLAYGETLSVGLIVSLAAHICVFQAFKHLEVPLRDASNFSPQEFKIENVVREKRYQVRPRPPLPRVPLPVDHEDLPEISLLAAVDVNLSQIPEMPPPPAIDTSSTAEPDVFIPYEEMPAPIGGIPAIQKELKYPVSALRARVRGTIYLKVRIGPDGEVTAVDIARSFGFKPCEQAAIKAVRSVRWKPARLRHKAVGVWVGIPVTFQL